MIKKLLSFFTSFVVVLSLGILTGCEHSSSGGGDSNNSAVGSWKVTSFEGRTDSDFVFVFNSDGTFTLGHRPGTYTVQGNKIKGSGNNPRVGEFDIDFTISGNTFAGEFIEHWHTPYKHVEVTATKQ